MFAVTGKIKNTGLIEVPMGITLREIIFDIGGGMLNPDKIQGGPDRRSFRRLHPGPVPRYAGRLRHAGQRGSMMGSGGMVVLDEDDCMVDVAKYFLSFTCNAENTRSKLKKLNKNNGLRGNFDQSIMMSDFGQGPSSPAAENRHRPSLWRPASRTSTSV